MGKIIMDVADIQLKEGSDTIRWKIGGNGKFSVEFVYNAMMVNDAGPYHKRT